MKNTEWILKLSAKWQLLLCLQQDRIQKTMLTACLSKTTTWTCSNWEVRKTFLFAAAAKQFLVIHKSVASLGIEKRLPSWQECPVMTHHHMHYKACEEQNNAVYCQINRQTSFNENSLWCLHTGEPSQSEPRWGGAWDMSMRSGVTSFNSCPNPKLETVSPLHWHWIRLDFTRSFSHLQLGQSFPCCFPTSNFTWLESIHSL